MKVSELIEKLKSMPQDMQVILPVPEHWEGVTEYELVVVANLGGFVVLSDGRTVVDAVVLESRNG